MEIIQLGLNKIKTSININDLSKYNLNMDSFMAYKIHKNPLLLDLLNYIDNNIFKIVEKNLIFELYIVNNTDIEIFIEIVHTLFYKSYFVYRKNKNNIEIKNCDFIIFEFLSFDFFCDFFSIINKYIKNNNLYFLFNYFEFYEYKDSYFFIIKKINLFYLNYLFIFFNILEFYDNIYFSDLIFKKIKEYGNLIFDYQNFNVFNKTFIDYKY